METRSQVLTVDSEAVRQVISLALCALCGSVCVSILNIPVFMTEVLPKWLRGAVVNGTSSCTQHQGTITPYHHTIIRAILGVWDLCYIIWKVSRYHSRKTSCSNVLQRFLVKNNLFQFFLNPPFSLWLRQESMQWWQGQELLVTDPRESSESHFPQSQAMETGAKLFAWFSLPLELSTFPGDIQVPFMNRSQVTYTQIFLNISDSWR